MPHHHRHARPAGQAEPLRQGPRRVLARDRADVPRRRRGRGLPAVSRADARLNPDGTDQDDWDDHWDTVRRGRQGQPGQRLPPRDGAQAARAASRAGRDRCSTSAAGRASSRSTSRAANPQRPGVRRRVQRRGRPASPAMAAARAASGARFFERNLLEPVTLAEDQPPATHAVCSEVLEHVDDPTTLMRNVDRRCSRPGAKVVVTVPGGPRSAFDKHIGHFRHFTGPTLHQVLTDAGLDVDRVLRTGFPFFNLYKLAVIARGEKLVARRAGPHAASAALVGSRRRSPRVLPPAASSSTATTRGSAGRWPRVAHVPLVGDRACSSPGPRCGSPSAAAAPTCRRTTRSTAAWSSRPPSPSTSTSRSTAPSPTTTS